VRLWVPELQNVSGGNVHTVWTMSNNALAKLGISLGETYPNPITVAPEWSRHYGKSVSTSHVKCLLNFSFNYIVITKMFGNL
jgi:deoxyribodipyrimidine photo-lyase